MPVDVGWGRFLRNKWCKEQRPSTPRWCGRLESKKRRKKKPNRHQRWQQPGVLRREQEADISHHLDMELLKRRLQGLAEEYGRRFPSASK